MTLNTRSYVWPLRGLDPEIKILSLEEQVLQQHWGLSLVILMDSPPCDMFGMLENAKLERAISAQR